MAGGTGGHVFPGLAIATALRERGDEILWVGTRGRMEERLVPPRGFEIRYVNVKGVRRNGLLRLMGAPLMVARAMLEARAILREFRPHVAIGMGGYASGPTGLMAALMGIPVLLHEQNAAAGLTNRLLSRVCRRILLGFPGAFSGPKVEVVGNPVRAEIAALHQEPREYGQGPLRILVVGGSLGAKALNELVPGALLALGGGIEVLHQCGAGNQAAVARLYEGAPFRATVQDFIEDMAAAYRGSGLIICRAGALTCAEVAAARLPAVFVPLPTAVDDHQTKNASVLVERGGALLMPQARLGEDSLAEMLRPLVSTPEALAVMSRRMGECAALDSTDRVLRAVDAAAGEAG
ncbi:MAG: undecaprenyldiphospho-muramoylpentapeptide beta-N-acetylglucosaminyltransferase [Succinivibrionaceae bacterium]|nr:undecaprenyldiphospho-muramoylpentapeptide beta-N-acetylglucosaminyltransferase [Succinivibrionaceae bacterium]